MRSFYLMISCGMLASCSALSGFGDFRIGRDSGADALATDGFSPDHRVADGGAMRDAHLPEIPSDDAGKEVSDHDATDGRTDAALVNDAGDASRPEELPCNCRDDNGDGLVDESGGCWSEITTRDAPTPRSNHTMVTVGNERETVMVWGGTGPETDTNTGGSYDAVTDTWTATDIASAPSPRYGHTAAWTERYMVVVGGFSRGAFVSGGSRLDPSMNLWYPMVRGTERWTASAVWIPPAQALLVFGGGNPGALGAAGLYNPGTDAWSTVATERAPTPRSGHVAVFDPTRTRVIIWGGGNPELLGDGASYDPLLDQWFEISSLDAPAARQNACAAWVSDMDAMLVFGGRGGENSGALYFPGSDTWMPIATAGAPSVSLCRGVWAGSALVVFWNQDRTLVGARYNPFANEWCPIPPQPDSPPARSQFTVACIRDRIMIWGGVNEAGDNLGTGYLLTVN